MERVNIKTETIHGGKDQDARFDVMNNFKTGKTKILIATDVSARGIDIPNVDYVVNYDMPEQVENYVHRCGRTGRGNSRGTAVSFCSKEENDLLKEIEEFIGKTVKVTEIDKSAYQNILEQSDNGTDNWQDLLKNAEAEEQQVKKLKKKRRKKK